MIFGPLPIEPDALANTLIPEVIRKMKQQGKGADWTKTLKAVLRKMGKDRGYEVNPDSENGDPSQFLLDLIWWKNSEDMDIVLGVESEWGSKRDVLHDFGKLLAVKAPLKLMVFDKRKDVIRDIQERYMQKFSQHIEGEHYLLLELDTPRKEARPFHFLVPSSGQLSVVTFQRLPSVTWNH